MGNHISQPADATVPTPGRQKRSRSWATMNRLVKKSKTRFATTRLFSTTASWLSPVPSDIVPLPKGATLPSTALMEPTNPGHVHTIPSHDSIRSSDLNHPSPKKPRSLQPPPFQSRRTKFHRPSPPASPTEGNHWSSRYSSSIVSSLFSTIEPETLSSITTFTNQSTMSCHSLLVDKVWSNQSHTESVSTFPKDSSLQMSPIEMYKLLCDPAAAETDIDLRSNIYQRVTSLCELTDSTMAQVCVALCLVKGWGVSPNHTLGFKQLTTLAEQGAKEAYYPLAMCYLRKHSCSTIPSSILESTAFRWLRDASEIEPSDDIPKDIIALAQLRLGSMLLKGQGICTDTRQAFDMFLKSADNGNKYAQYIVGCRSEIQQDTVRATFYYTQSAEQGYTEAQTALGILLMNQDETKQGIRWLQLAADAEHPRALLALGLVHHLGQGVDKDDERAAFYYHAAADHHEVSAQYFLGLHYHLGTLGLPVQPDKAEHFLRQAGDSGFAPAQRVLGLMYAQGYLKSKSHEVQEGHKTALTWFRRAASLGDVRALGLVGHCYELGYGTSINYAVALQYYQKAARIPGDYQCAAQLALALLLLRMERHCDAFTWFQRASQLAPPLKDHQDRLACTRTAMLMVARYRLHGWGGIAKAPLKAFQLLTHLTSHGVGDGQAHYWLAACLEEGIPGVCHRDLPAAFQTYKTAASAGDMDAEFQVALMYANGQGVDHDPIAAFEWYQKAANKGHRTALYSLGLYHLKGMVDDQEPDLDQAQVYFECAAKLGNVTAMVALATLQRRSTSPATMASAVQWYHQAAHRGDPVAQRDLGLIHDSGQLGVEKNQGLALHYLQQAAYQGDAQALLHMARYYQHGTVVKRDVNKALQYYMESARRGEGRGSFAAAQLLHAMCRYGEAHVLYWKVVNAQFLDESIRNVSKWMVARYVLSGIVNVSDLDEAHRISAKDSFDIVQDLVTQGFEQAFATLGTCYLKGQGVATDYAQAAYWLDLAANKTEDTDAMLTLVDMYEQGIGVTANTQTSLDYIHRSASLGNAEGQFRMGVAYWQGQGNLEVDPVQAAHWLSFSASQGHKDSHWVLGSIALDSGDEAQAIQWWQTAVDLGSVHAMRSLALWHLRLHDENTTLEETCVKQAIDLLTQAVRSGDVMSLACLGQLHLAGVVTGVHSTDDLWAAKQKHEQAVAKQCLQLAAVRGHPGAMVLIAHLHVDKGHHLLDPGDPTTCNAQIADASNAYETLLHYAETKTRIPRLSYLLATCKDDGLSTTKDDRAAFQWYMVAAQQDHDADAMYKIGRMYAQGRIPHQKTTCQDMQALTWFLRAVGTRAHADAEYGIACYFFKGIDGIIAPDEEQGKAFLVRAGNHGHVGAMEDLGRLLLTKQQKWYDQREGYHWLERAAEQASPTAQRQMGVLFHRGQVVDTGQVIVAKDPSKALHYLLSATAAQDMLAKVYLGAIYEIGDGVPASVQKAKQYYRQALVSGENTNKSQLWVSRTALQRMERVYPQETDKIDAVNKALGPNSFFPSSSIQGSKSSSLRRHNSW